MPKNNGRSYELISRAVFQAIISQDLARNIRVQHDVRLQGKATQHKIDVFWQFEVAHIEYSTVVEVKHWDRPVNQGELIKFKGVLDDLPGQPRGVFVTSTGYQSGAEEYARANGISLYVLQERRPPNIRVTDVSYATYRITGTTFTSPDSPPVCGRIDTSGYPVMEFVEFRPRFSNVKFSADPAWRSLMARRHGTRFESEMASLSITSFPREIT